MITYKKITLALMAIPLMYHAHTLSLHPETTSLQQESKYPIVYAVATPCSAMTEVLRMVHKNGHFKVMHATANWAYCHVHNYLDIVKGWYREDAPTTYQEAANEIYKQAETTPIFAAESTHTATEFLEEQKDFVARPEVQFVFLIGNPAAMTISYYEKKKNYFDKLPEVQMSNSIGLKDLYTFITKLKEQGKRIFICRSEDFFYKKEATVQALCKYLAILYKPEALQWEDLSEGFSALPFWTIEKTQCSLDWQLDAIKGPSFVQPKQYAIDAQGNPTFEEIINLEHRRICMNAYHENMEYYDLIMQLNN